MKRSEWEDNNRSEVKERKGRTGIEKEREGDSDREDAMYDSNLVLYITSITLT
jgi:hypothetical protein